VLNFAKKGLQQQLWRNSKTSGMAIEAADKIPDKPTSQTASEALTNGQTDGQQQMLPTAESMQQQTQPAYNIKDNFVFDPTMAKTRRDDDEDPIKTATLLEDIIDCPVLKEDDYFYDDEFSAMYMYLKYDQMTNDTDKDRKLLCFVSENYCLTRTICIKYPYPVDAERNV